MSSFDVIYGQVTTAFGDVLTQYLGSKGIGKPDGFENFTLDQIRDLLTEHNARPAVPPEGPAVSSSATQRTVGQAVNSTAQVLSYVIAPKVLAQRAPVAMERAPQLFWFSRQQFLLQEAAQGTVVARGQKLLATLEELKKLLGGELLNMTTLGGQIVAVPPFEGASRATSRWMGTACSLVGMSGVEGYFRGELTNLVKEKVCPSGVDAKLAEVQTAYRRALEQAVAPAAAQPSLEEQTVAVKVHLKQLVDDGDFNRLQQLAVLCCERGISEVYKQLHTPVTSAPQ